MSSAFHQLNDQINSDAEYAWAVHCNLAVPIMDSVRCTHEQANRAAARIMHQWFGLDITKHEHWKSIESQWSQSDQAASGEEGK
jgi:hypothetical protein